MGLEMRITSGRRRETAVMERHPTNYEGLSDIPPGALVTQCSQVAFPTFWKRHHAKSLVFVKRIVRNDDDAQELVQEAWLNSWRY
jgi:hypothetical protein